MRSSSCFIPPLFILIGINRNTIVITSLKTKMDPAKLTEFLKCLTFVDIQWVVQWWRIKVISNCGFKENCVLLVGLHHCSYYPTCRIARQSSDRQWVPCGNGSYHTLAFTKRILGRIQETWPQRKHRLTPINQSVRSCPN